MSKGKYLDYVGLRQYNTHLQDWVQKQIVDVDVDLSDYPTKDELDVAMAGKASLNHTHEMSEVEGLTDALAKKADIATYADEVDVSAMFEERFQIDFANHGINTISFDIINQNTQETVRSHELEVPADCNSLTIRRADYCANNDEVIANINLANFRSNVRRVFAVGHYNSGISFDTMPQLREFLIYGEYKCNNSFGWHFQGSNYMTKFHIGKCDMTNFLSVQWMFTYNQTLQDIDLSGCVNANKVITFKNMFNSCAALEKVDLTGWDFASAENVGNLGSDDMFGYCPKLKTIVGGLKNLRLSIYFAHSPLTKETAQEIIDNVMNVSSARIVFSTYTKSLLTSDMIQKANSKGWTIA